MKTTQIVAIAAIGAGAIGIGYAIWRMLSGAPAPGKARLYGKVTDADTGNGIQGVSVVVSTKTGTTDANGDYSISDIDTGSKMVAFAKTGYDSVTQTVTLVEGDNLLDMALVATGEECADYYLSNTQWVHKYDHGEPSSEANPFLMGEEVEFFYSLRNDSDHNQPYFLHAWLYDAFENISTPDARALGLQFLPGDTHTGIEYYVSSAIYEAVMHTGWKICVVQMWECLGSFPDVYYGELLCQWTIPYAAYVQGAID